MNEVVEAYFGALQLPDHPTVYDHLVLSLREQDIIATFNWDPLLVQAYRRNSIGLRLPKLAFLHGSVAVGSCDADEIIGPMGARCSRCDELFKRTPLLYPVRHKNYAENPSIASQWNLLKHGFKHAFMITIFGYSGPKTDKEAISAMQEAWGSVDDRPMEQTAFITLQNYEEVRDAWDEFIHTHHFEVQSDFYKSWIANHPRRTGEAYLNQYLDAKFISDNPIPCDFSLSELHAWYDQFRRAEEAHSD